MGLGWLRLRSYGVRLIGLLWGYGVRDMRLHCG